MDIDITSSILGNIGPESLNNSTARANTGSSKTPEAADLELRVEYDSIIRRSIELEDYNEQAVKEAQEALENGSLDTPQSILQAAQNILKLGI